MANPFQHMDKVIEHIYANLAAEQSHQLSIDVISNIAGFSKYHFHRVFQAYTGVTLHKYIQLLRLKKASYHLAFEPALKIIDIALDAGFESHEAFSRAFKKIYQQSPSQFRAKPQWEDWMDKYRFQQSNYQEGEYMPANPAHHNHQEVHIIDFNQLQVALLSHTGAPKKLNHSIANFIEWRKSTNYSPITTSRTFGIAYNDPNAVAEEDFKFDVCASVTEAISENPQGVTNSIIPHGRCATLIHYGSHDLMGDKIYYLYRDWLPQSGESLRSYPCFFEYKNFFPQVPESELVTIIYLPIE
ncbi:MAG: GyrI-like domain-containing protein [Kangiellaceae bacterium]|nr:GyrI-like domain-containing protein [Kangiellaceae bacterium]